MPETSESTSANPSKTSGSTSFSPQKLRGRRRRAALIASLLCALAACLRHSPTTVPPSAPGDPALSIAGGNAQSYGRALGSVMRTWGLVCIAVNYTHARGTPLGAPGTLLQQGASPANAFRAHAAVTVLSRLGYVDVRRVAAHGHSMGAFVTTAFVAAYPADVSVGSHTSGGVLLDAVHREGMPVPSVAQAQRIQVPYQWHHGLLDYAVPFLLDKRFDSVLTAPHEGHLYPRLSHAEVATDPEVLSRVRAWYTLHGMF